MPFLKNSPTPFHAVESLKQILEKAGFSELLETDAWKLQAGAKHYITRNGSSIVAFRMGDADPVEKGFRMVGAHTDSPCLRLRPHAELGDRHYLRYGAEIYGGVILSTWFDRDLSLAGRVFYSRSKGKGLGSSLVDFGRPIAVVPNLAIHLNRSVNENRTINKQTEMVPLVAHTSKELSVAECLREELSRSGVKDAEKILSHELYFYDTQAPSLVGLKEEFLASGRLDNLLSCYVGASALTQSKGDATAVLVCSDHEEVGSASAPGAQGPFLKSVLERICETNENFIRAMARSILVSTDNAHGIHPSYPDRHDGNHAPILNQGPAIKTNTNQRYATSSETAAIFTECCEQAEVPVQNFVARNDMPCGSTIGPITATLLGVRTVDVGIPTFAMHSIRELAGTQDTGYLTQALEQFFQYPELP